MPEAILVTGFLGAGKSALVARLRAALPEREVLEGDGSAVVDADAARGPIVAVADAANLGDCLGDPLVGPLVSAQIRTAGLVVLTRTDLVPAAPARAALAGLGEMQVVEVGPGDLPPGLARRIASLPPAPPGPPGPTATPPVPMAEWRYTGRAEVPETALEALLADRPEGLYRLSGTVRCGRHGVEVEVVGRLRQTRPVPTPAETSLAAVGIRARFRPNRMALRFSDAVAARGWLTGLFGHR